MKTNQPASYCGTPMTSWKRHFFGESHGKNDGKKHVMETNSGRYATSLEVVKIGRFHEISVG